MYGLRGVGDHIFEKFSRDCTGSGVFSRSTQGSAALFCCAVQCRSMVFRRGGVLHLCVLHLFGTVLDRTFQRCMGWGRVGDDIFEKLGRDGHGLCRVWICPSPGTKNTQQRQKKREWPQHTSRPHPKTFKNGFPTPKGGGGGCLTHQKPRKSGAGDADIAISAPVTRLAPAAENGQNFNQIHIFSNTP